MIPHLLQLKNFLSYGPDIQTIDFSHYHLICLSGKNGHGKSAILDAITWAIWGQARKSSGNSKADAGLVHLGQKHMMIILEFEVSGQQYRIRREYVQTKSKPFASLDFGIKQQDGKLIALTDKTIKDTQDRIERTIGITYESFVNSTFLRQGQSNEFSKKSPKERKEILAQILQLQRFEEQKKIAVAQMRKLQQEYATQISIQNRIEQELTQLSCVSELLQNSTLKIQDIMSQKITLHNHSQNLEIRKQELLQQEHQRLFIDQQIKNFQNELEDIKKEIHALAPIWHTTQQALAQNVNISHLDAQEKILQLELQKHQELLQQKLQLKEIYLATKEKISELMQTSQKKFEFEKDQLNQQKAQQEEAIKQLAKQQHQEQFTINKLKHEFEQHQTNQTSLKQQLLKYQETKILLDQAQLTFDLKKDSYQSICSQGTYLKQHLHKITETIKSSTTQLKTRCELCEQPINHDIQQKISQKNILEKVAIEESINHLKQEALVLKSELAFLQKNIDLYKKEYDHKIQIEAQYHATCEQYEKTLKNLDDQHKKINLIEQEQTNLQTEYLKTQQLCSNLHLKIQQIQLSDQYITLTKQLTEIENKAKTNIYQQAQHLQCEKQLENIRFQKTTHANLQEQTLTQETRKLQLFVLFKKAHTLNYQINELSEKYEFFKNLDQDMQEIYTLEQTTKQQIIALDQEHQKLLIDQGSLEQNQKKQYALINEQKNLANQIKINHQEILDYQEIAKALGKDGIQALLIEQAIPEIEHETNLVLARLTNNQTQIFIESLRDLKKGGSRETLDIKIADSFGLRDYELFSGGEAFRIDFALRIGISKLLARRAGTTLQTIFIDEGFGSQDEEGLQLIMDNLYKIQDDFAKIIVVSHLPEMKEQFPVQFIVDKKRSGSTISIIHQG